MILIIALHGEVVNNGVALDVGRGCAIFHNNRRTVQVHAVVNDQERVVVVDNIVVHTDTIQVLLEQVLEEEVLLLEGSLLLLDGQLVEVDFVVTLVEAVQLSELVIGVWVDTNDLLNHLVRLFLGIWVRLVEWKHLFFLSLELTAELSCLEDSFTKMLVATESLHALQTVSDQCAQMLTLLVS